MIGVKHDGEHAYSPAENCVFCDLPTRYWYVPKDVPVCPDCAKEAEAHEVPNKRDWLISQGVNLPADWKCNADLERAKIAAKVAEQISQH